MGLNRMNVKSPLLVPHGTVLGPHLFLLFINDLPAVGIQSQIRLFADDAIVYLELKSIASPSQLQQDLNKLSQWTKTWQMEFNVSKCCVMHVSRKRNTNKATYYLDGTPLETTDSHPYLGVHLAADLRWNTHCSHVARKANRTLGFICRNFYHTPRDIKV